MSEKFEICAEWKTKEECWFANTELSEETVKEATQVELFFVDYGDEERDLLVEVMEKYLKSRIELAGEKTEAGIRIWDSYDPAFVHDWTDTDTPESLKFDFEELYFDKRTEVIAEAFDSKIRDSYCPNHALQGWHIEFWINKETLQWSTSGELSQNSWTVPKDSNWIYACKIDFQNLNDCFPDMEEPTEEDYKEAIEQTIANLDTIEFIRAVLAWGGDKETKEPRMEEYWV